MEWGLLLEYEKVVYRRPSTSDACFRCAMEGGHGGLMVRKGHIAGNISATAARWSGRHEALSSLIGVFSLGNVCLFSLLEANFFRFFRLL